ncbi:subtilisin [Pochonia chlamydosporia 170]|uniref:Subtilisin n=1 Tax=Pochonia chlamydosporia 170 TaxID=1380566 RepID=A0A179FAJ8_METCM|nr:subtilisin [Pochonia chlamydosporia 170]OAQ62482.1 subtilisin [Pochonia chlamydosporia 170]
MVRTSLVVSLVAVATSALAADVHGKNIVKTFVPGAYIFELEDGHDPDIVERSVGKHGTTRMKLDYDLFKGVSVQLHDIDKAHETAAKLADIPAVKAVFPVQLVAVPKPNVEWVARHTTDEKKGLLSSRAAQTVYANQKFYANKTDAYSPHIMTQIDKLHAKGITGKGVKIAVVDTGIDYKHPALGGCFGQGCLVSFGTDLVGDDYTGENTPHPDPDPMDCAGHGSHVAGIIAAQPNIYGFTGAAPGASLGAYRVFGCEGTAGTDVLIAAFNQAYQDGATVITSSVGGQGGWPEDPWCEVVSRIVEKGVPCTMSAGNSGIAGLFDIGSASSGRGVMAIASFDNVQTPAFFSDAKYQVDNGTNTPFRYAPFVNVTWDSFTLPAWSSSLDPEDCDSFPANTTDLSKYIVLVSITCGLPVQFLHAIDKGAKNFVVYGDSHGVENIAIPEDVSSAINSASVIDAETGATFINALKNGKKLILEMARPKTHLDVVNINNTATGGAVSLFSTWGPNWEMDTKPQFGAPGGHILSTIPRAMGSYGVWSGTSMSCPQVAGIIALIHEVRGTYDPGLIQNLLSTNAKPQLFNDGNKFYDFLAPVPQQGAGLIQAYDAAYATTLLSPSSLSFNDTDHLTKALEFNLTNSNAKKITYKFTNVPAIAMYFWNFKDSFPNFSDEPVLANATIKFSETSVTLNGGESCVISVSATPPKGLDADRLALWSGYIAINGTDGTSLSLPYQGLAGSLRDQTTITRARLFNSTGNELAPNSTLLLPRQGGASDGDTFPMLGWFLPWGSRKILAHIIPLSTLPPNNLTTEYRGVKTIGQPSGFPALWQSRGLNGFDFTGRLDSGYYAPPGRYKVIFRALRIFGNETKEEDWDVVTTPAFFIKYQDTGYDT